MIIRHYTDVNWDYSRWPNFKPEEFSCHHCGEMYWSPSVFDAAQQIRKSLGRPVKINSAHRCWYWNAHEGGAPMSEHKKIALDISLHGHAPAALFEAALDAGLSSFGFYQTFLHADPRPGRRWVASMKAKEQWKSYLASHPLLLAAASLG